MLLAVVVPIVDHYLFFAFELLLQKNYIHKYGLLNLMVINKGCSWLCLRYMNKVLAICLCFDKAPMIVA